MLEFGLKTQVSLIILLIVVVVLLFVIINNKYTEEFKTKQHKLGKVLETGERSIIYEVNIKQNDKNIDYLYKKFLIIEQTSVDKQVKINNNFKYSPEIIDYGNDYYIIENYDSTLENLVLNKKFNKEKLKNLIKILREYNKYKYNIDDLHLNNIVWSDKKNIFGIIDWDLIESKDKRLDNNLNDLDFIEQFISKRCKIIDSSMKKKFINMFTKVYNNQCNQKELLNTFKNIESENRKIRQQNNPY